MSVLKSHVGWKARHVKGMTLEEIKEKFDPVWKHFQDFIPIGSKEEAERFKRRGVSPTIPTASLIFTTATESTPYTRRKEKLKEMMELIPVEEVYVEALQVKHLIIDWEVHTEGQRSYWKITRLGLKETLNIRPASSDKEMEIWVELKRLCGVHHVTSNDKKIFMLVEKDYLLRKGLELVMIKEIKEKFDPVWKHFQDFIPIGSKEEAERFKRRGVRLEQDSSKKLKTSKEVPKEKLKEMMELIPVEETHTQNLMHAPVEWKLYDTCGVHHVTSNDKKIFMLVEKDYLLRKGLDDEFPLPEQLPTANEEKFPPLIQSDATAEELCAAAEVKE
nr:hypothetical protein [Tanacetum cinerariifolium]